MGTTPTCGANLENMGLSPITRECKVSVYVCVTVHCEGCHGYVHGLMLPHETLQDARPVIDTMT